MYKRILVALDGSQPSESILPYARSFAKTLKIPVELLQVIDPATLIPVAAVKHVHYQDVLTVERKYSSDYLKQVATSFSEPSSVNYSVEIGRPAEVIIDRAAAQAGTLIAMTTHGRSGITRWLLGSVAEKVLHAATHHLLLVRTTGEIKKPEAAALRRVVVPLDGSELAEMAIPHAVELARKMDLEIVLLRVFALPTPAYAAEEYAPNLEELWEQTRREAGEYLEKKLHQLQKEGLGRASTVLLEGYAAEKIINLARERAESLVAMCTHGRTGVGRWVLGSVTDRVVRHSDNPVLVIRAPIAKMALRVPVLL